MSSQFEIQFDVDMACPGCGNEILVGELVVVFEDDLRHVYCEVPKFAEPGVWESTGAVPHVASNA